MTRKFVYTVTMYYDAYDHYLLGIAATLPVAKRLAQKDWTAYELPDVAPTLKWQARQNEYKGNTRHKWVAIRNAYGSEYHINKQEVITS
jgi:hypothetical protein